VPVRVVTDSSCDLPQALADDLGIVIVPLTVRFGADERLDRRELTPTEFWARRASSAEPPETSAPPPSSFESAYRALSDTGADGVVVVAVSALLSGTVQMFFGNISDSIEQVRSGKFRLLALST